MKYRIITDAWNPHIEVAQAESEEKDLDLLTRRNALTLQDVMGAACSDRKEMLEQLLQRARKIDAAASIEGARFAPREHQVQKVSSLESEKTSPQSSRRQGKPKQRV